MKTLKLNKRFGVYVDYTVSEPRKVFYVGKGLQGRIRNFKRNKLHTNIANKYGIERILALETNDHTEAITKEIELIATYKTYVYGENYIFGANFTRGGEGATGRKYVPTSLTLKRQSEAQRGKKRKPWTLESRNHRIQTMTGKKHHIKDSIAFKKRCSDNQRKRMQNPELRKQMGDAQRGKSMPSRGRKYTDAQRLSRSLQLKAYWARKREEKQDVK